MTDTPVLEVKGNAVLLASGKPKTANAMEPSAGCKVMFVVLKSKEWRNQDKPFRILKDKLVWTHTNCGGAQVDNTKSIGISGKVLIFSNLTTQGQNRKSK